MTNIWIKSIVYSAIVTVIIFLAALVLKNNFTENELIGGFCGLLFIGCIAFFHNNISKADAINSGIQSEIKKLTGK